MNAPRTQLAGLAPAMLMFLAIGLLTGCEQLESDAARADRLVENYLAEADALPHTAGEAPSERQVSLLRQAAGESAASPSSLAQARLQLGQAQYETAQQVMRQIEVDELEAVRLTWQIDRLARQIARNNTRLDGYRLAEPAAAKEQIGRSIAEAQGGPDQRVWFSHQQVELPTLSAAKQYISQLEGELANRRQRIDQLQVQRSQLVQQAEQADQQARNGEREQTMEAFRQASGLRKQAADLLIQIEAVQAEIMPLEQELAKARDQQAAVEQAIAALQERSRELDQYWAEVQRQIQNQQGLSRSIAEGQGEGEAAQASIAAQAEALGAIIARIDEGRTAAAQMLQESIGSFQSAAAAADQRYREAESRQGDIPGQRSDYQALEHVKLVGNPNIFQFRQAMAMQSLATLQHGWATHLQGRLELSRSIVPILRAANVQVPAVLEEGELDQRLAEARQEAEAAYQAAGERLETISQASLAGRVPPLADMARATHALVLYGRSQLALQQGQEDQARQHLQAAQSLLRAAGDNQQARPLLPTVLPAELAGAMARAPAPVAPAPAEPEDE